VKQKGLIRYCGGVRGSRTRNPGATRQIFHSETELVWLEGRGSGKYKNLQKGPLAGLEYFL
jgi:hypothetical protein